MSAVWLGSSVVRVLARSAWGPGFEIRLGCVIFPPLCHLVAQCMSLLGLEAAKGLSRRFRHGSSGFGDELNLIKQGGNCHMLTVWPDSSVVIVLTRSARGPGFESRSGHVRFPPL